MAKCDGLDEEGRDVVKSRWDHARIPSREKRGTMTGWSVQRCLARADNRDDKGDLQIGKGGNKPIKDQKWVHRCARLQGVFF